MAAEPNPRLKPAALQPGDTIGVVAPASPFNRESFERSCENLRRQGYKVLVPESVFGREAPYFAGTAEQRARDLQEMFRNPEVRAIICARGGYGSNYLLGHIDLEVLRRAPKIFMGYSDVTALLTWFHDAAGLVTFHGPMMNKDFASDDGVHASSLMAALGGASQWNLGSNAGLEALAPGETEGNLYGGCLSILVASLGTPYEIHTAGTLLFLEDVAAKPYQIDRMLMQLKLAGKFHGVRGIIFGEMLDCRQSEDQAYKLQDVVKRVVDDLGVPVAYGLRSGHVTHSNVTLPLGVRAALHVGAEASLTILETATVPAAATAKTR
ncbi:MAG TPA: LD-carboxypeptidase [Terriglobales bacterium]|nr:LD-carboxypeptidase [Terriglobales bacterium]